MNHVIDNSKNNLQLYVASFTEAEKKEVVANWLEFSRKGFIDECLLRSKAIAYVKDVLGSNSGLSPVGFMKDIAFEICLNHYLSNS